uniref:Transmembrane protein n=1 Tax=Heterorhabditis bacteriophora TaxID=37862 RepID=A0A1I7WF38_HETBA
MAFFGNPNLFFFQIIFHFYIFYDVFFRFQDLVVRLARTNLPQICIFTVEFVFPFLTRSHCAIAELRFFYSSVLNFSIWLLVISNFLHKSVCTFSFKAIELFCWCSTLLLNGAISQDSFVGQDRLELELNPVCSVEWYCWRSKLAPLLFRGIFVLDILETLLKLMFCIDIRSRKHCNLIFV